MLPLMNRYQVKLKVYEGPFDLLLDLIARKKVNIHEISVSEIAHDYIGYLNKMKDLDLEIASEFLVVAATLLEIKAVSLFASDEKEKLSSEDLSLPMTKEELVERLVEYKKFKRAGLELRARLESQSKFYPRKVELEERYLRLLPDLKEFVQLEDLRNFGRILLRKDDHQLIESVHIIPQPLSVEEKIKIIFNKVKRKKKLTFKELTRHYRKRIEVITAFLALLELFGKGKIELEQNGAFEDIKIKIKMT